ncbi:MAG: hypoxanthine phosphoribosyltransferase [Candidatus Dadabacteria bacterium]
MPSIKLHDKTFDTYLSADAIQQKIQELADQVNTEFANRRPLFIAILNGSFMFAADLFKKITIEAEICFIKLASYRGMKSTGHVVTAIGLDQDLYGRDVIILEDIVDTGKTLHQFLPQLSHQQPKSLRIIALLHKAEAAKYNVPIDYVGFTIPDKFVVGYGLDYDGLGRNLGEIYQLSENH